MAFAFVGDGESCEGEVICCRKHKIFLKTSKLQRSHLMLLELMSTEEKRET